MAHRALLTRKKAHFIARVWLIWTAIAILSYARHYFEDTHPFDWTNGSLPDFLALSACFYPWAILTPAIFRLEARFPLKWGEWKLRLGLLLLASVIFCFLALQIGAVMELGISYAFAGQAPPRDFLWHFPWFVFFSEEFFFWITLSAGCALRNFVQTHQQARQATQLALEKSQLETSLRQAELENLRIRLNPHFLFNTLQNISVLTQQNPKLASRMLTRLGDLLRSALRRDVSSETTVCDEIALTEDYLAVEKMRFGDRLAVEVNLAPGTQQALIPSFLLQPLAENAVIHGLRGVKRMGMITMRALQESDRLVLIVADNGVGVSDQWSEALRPEAMNSGVGLSSTRGRLNRMYPGEHEFVIRRRDEGGTEVRIVIPFRLRVGSEETVPSEQPATVNC